MERELAVMRRQKQIDGVSYQVSGETLRFQRKPKQVHTKNEVNSSVTACKVSKFIHQKCISRISVFKGRHSCEEELTW